MHTNCTKYIIFYAHHSCKEKQSVKQRNMPISGPIRSDPVIRPDPVITRTRLNMPTGCVMCKMGACWTVDTQSICLSIFYHSISMPADLLPLIPACLLVLCICICHTCVYGVSLSAVPAVVEPHYSPCLLV